MFDSIGNTSNDPHPLDEAYLIGTVIDNVDPDRQQRVKATVPSHLEGAASELPWIGPFKASEFGMSNTHGSVNVPIIGSLIIIRFQAGDLNKGVWLGCISSKALGAAMPIELATNYPNRYGFFDPKGNKQYTDLVSGETEYVHNSGTRVKFDANGDLNATVVGNLNGVVSGNTNLTVAGAVTGTAASWSVTGPTTFNSPVTFASTVNIQGVTTATTVAASGNVTAAGISLISHHHTDSRGGQTSGAL